MILVKTHFTCIMYTEYQSQVSAPGPMALLFDISYTSNVFKSLKMSLKVCKTPPCCKREGESDTNTQGQEKTSVIDY